jgi:hypothetical protein
VAAIRPPIFPPTTPPAGPARADPARLAAQKAFFEAALGKTGVPAPHAAPAASVPPPAAAQRTFDASAEKPQKILRPGSLLDIKI